jgi:hypothetical protein
MIYKPDLQRNTPYASFAPITTTEEGLFEFHCKGRLKRS